MPTADDMPEWLEPMAATLTQERFGTGGDWLFERKFDGIRLLAYKRGDDVSLFSRNRLPQNLPDVARAIASLPVHDVILDGEVTWDGHSGYHVFDILWMDGQLLTMLPLEERRALLEALPFEAPMRRVELLDDADPWDRARRERWEGVIAKRRGSPYEHRRSKHWLKMKCEFSQEFVVGGFTDPQGARVGLGALLVGYYDGADLVFAGKIGTGFDTKMLLDLRHRLDTIRHRAQPVHQGGRPAASAGALGQAADRGAGVVHRVDAQRQAASPAADRRSLRQGPSRRGQGARVITHPEKVLFPDDGITKGEVAAYYEAMAPVILPHLRGRPITMERYPAGIGTKGFWQKDVSKGFPEWLQRVEVPKKDGVVHHPVVTDTESLLWITNQNTITQHIWASRLPDLKYPDLCVFDLDPSNDDVAEVRAAAIGLRDLLEKLGLPSWVKTTGSKGFHIVVPLDGKTTMGAAARFANAVGTLFVRLAPDKLTQEFSKADRRGRIYMDTGRNGYSATFAAPYTIRAKRGAPVSAPCTWEELERGTVSPGSFTLRNMPERIAAVGDVWGDLHRRGRSLKRAMDKVKEFSSGDGDPAHHEA